MSTSFAPPAPVAGTVAPDPSKHVNYTLGMLLGVDDFNQEFAYLSGRDQWLARDALGYGTLCGLGVSVDTTAKGPRLNVRPGTALTPRGKLVRLQPAQCAYLNDWVSANQDAVLSQTGGSPPNMLLRLSLVLCYRACATDPVPIAGEPCRTAAELTANSRLTDDFRLELRVTPPAQQEEDAVREFVALLDQAQITDDPGFFPSLPEFEDGIRAALLPTSPLDASADFLFGSPLAGFHIHPAEVADYLRTAFRIWVTEVRPVFQAIWSTSTCGCGGSTETANSLADECLLLTEVDVPLVPVGGGSTWTIDDTQPVTLDQSRRPILVHLRMQQEWMLSCLKGGL